MLKNVGFGSHKNFWRLIWMLKLPPKVSIFVWQVDHNLLPTNTKIVVVNPSYNSTCPRCGVAEESLTHAFRDGMKAREVLLHGGIDGCILNSDWTTGIDCLESTMRLLDKTAFECFMLVIWNMWNARNNFLFKGCMEDSKVVWDRMLNFVMIFASIMCPKQMQQPKWSKPPCGFLKINFDAAWSSNKAGVGFIARDTKGFMHGGGMFLMQDVASAAWAEAECFLRSLEWARRKILSRVIFEGDCAAIINRITNKREDIIAMGFLLRQCRDIIND